MAPRPRPNLLAVGRSRYGRRRVGRSSRSWRRWAALRPTATAWRKPASAASPGSRSPRRSPRPAPPHARLLSRTCDDSLQSMPPSARSAWQRRAPGHSRPVIDVTPSSPPLPSRAQRRPGRSRRRPAPAPAETTSAPTETEPAQTTSNPTPTTGGGGSCLGRRRSSSSGSQKQSAFGAGGSLGPGSSPNG